MTHLSEIPEQEEYIGLLLLIFQYIVQDAGAATTMGKKYYYTYCARIFDDQKARKILILIRFYCISDLL